MSTSGHAAEALDLSRALLSPTAHYFGVYPAVVTDNQDPDSQGRVKVRLPWSPDSGGGSYDVWARLATTMAGGNRGTWLVPDTGDEILVAFLGGDPRWPYVIGALWNGQDDPPESMDADNNIKSIVSRSGIKVTLDDTSGAETLTLQTPAGQQVTMTDAGNQMTVADSNGNSIELGPSGITITAASMLQISAATAEIDIGQVTVNSASWVYSGAITCDTIIAGTVVGASYTPGAGEHLVTAIPAAATAVTERLQWLSPAPLWNDAVAGPAASGFAEPWIAELASDSFITDFLAMMAGTVGSPPDLANTTPAQTSDGSTSGPLKLFQSLSQRYYLVVATLVCLVVGIPDHAVQRARGERPSFVLRQLAADGTELAWVPASGSGAWQPANGDTLVPGERQLPMHPAPVAAFADRASTAGILGMAAGSVSTRTVLYGYIPVSQRERLTPAMTDTEVVAALAAVQATMALPNPPENPIIDELIARVVQPLAALQKAPPAPNANWPYYPSLYLILDLGDWLSTYLPKVYSAITQNTSLPAGSNASTLLTQIQSVTVTTATPSGTMTLADAIQELELAGFGDLVTGKNIAGPTKKYDLSTAALPPSWLGMPKDAGSLAATAQAALTDANVPVTVPEELSGLIKNDPVLPPGVADPNETTYLIRAVFEHPPCQPVLSAATRPFVLARPLDADAPARKIRIQLPEITNMRRFNRGVALEMPPGLRRLLDRVTPDLLKGSGLSSDPGIELGMICTFSLQIIFLVAFIVMFIFLILLNIFFWWLPFLKVCFPIPVRPANPPAPAPGQQP